jgi:tripartite-type tricarboxylate transporter receptor subunit TctC
MQRNTLHRIALLSAMLAAGIAAAQDYPQRPLRFLVPFAPGGGLDITARLLSPSLSQSLGKQVVIDNRPGAGGVIALEMASRAAPDGHTFIMASASHVIQAVMGIGQFDFFRDLAPVSEVIATPYVMATWPGLPVRSVKDLVAYAKAHPQKLNYASTGNGTLQHLATALFLQQMNIEALHVPYKGVAAVLPDLFAGRAHILMSSLSALGAQVRAKSVNALAISTRERHPAWPDLPTMIEAGVPGYEVTQWQGVLITSGTPPAIVTRLQRDIAHAARLPEVAKVFAADGSTTVASTPAVFKAALEADRKKWSEVVKRAGIKAN